MGVPFYDILDNSSLSLVHNSNTEPYHNTTHLKSHLGNGVVFLNRQSHLAVGPVRPTFASLEMSKIRNITLNCEL